MDRINKIQSHDMLVAVVVVGGGLESSAPLRHIRNG